MPYTTTDDVSPTSSSSPESPAATVVVHRTRGIKRSSGVPPLFIHLTKPFARSSGHYECSNLSSPSPRHEGDIGQEVDEAWKTLDDITALQFVLDHDRGALAPPTPISPLFTDMDLLSAQRTSQGSPTDHKKPFQKWMNTLRKRGMQRLRSADLDPVSPKSFRNIDTEVAKSSQRGHRRCSSSDSSIDFVTAMKSPSISLTSFTAFGLPRRSAGVASNKAPSRTGRSSRASISGLRTSEDSQYPAKSPAMDPAIVERSLQRRRILDELISTEEGYIADVRFLMNVYVTILASLPTQSPGLRSSINRNMTEIVQLHEELLKELRLAIPDSEYVQYETSTNQPPKSARRGHYRWRSLDSVPEDKSDGMAWLRAIPGVIADPQVAAEVARIFISKMNSFFIYEEYGAKYELMIKDIAEARRTMTDWEKYQKGLETLAASLGPEKSHRESSKKSLTVSDLLVKPIQRVCKYPLLFAELLKYTPVVDCPQSHMVVEDALLRLREATAEINRATNDPKIKCTLQRTWNLQDRLVFADQILDVASKNRIRSFGHIHLCGALHVCWQTKDSVSGQYLICLLYRDWICIASASRFGQTYTILLCVSLTDVKVEDADNGRGLQCHTSPYSWKLVFQCDNELYEIIMTACSPQEYYEWRSRLERSSSAHISDPLNPMSFRAHSMSIKSLGAVFGKPGTISRQISIHHAGTAGPKMTLCQVVLKNTTVERESYVAVPAVSAKTCLHRSQSLVAPPESRVTVLSPSRGDRSRLEAILSDVWTREALPFPGMTVRSRSEHLVRSSASSVMRKLSVASIASSFTKRSVSMASTTTTRACVSVAAAMDDSNSMALVATKTVIDNHRGALFLRSQKRGDSSSHLTIDTKSVSTMPIRSGDDRNNSDGLGSTGILSVSDTAIDKYGITSGSRDPRVAIPDRSHESAVQIPRPSLSMLPASPAITAFDGVDSALASCQNSVISSRSDKGTSAVQVTPLPLDQAPPGRLDTMSVRVSSDAVSMTPSRRGTGDTAGCGSETPSSIKSARRWTKGGINRGVSFRGLRNLFA
ncbi:hypothetical protein PspLS_05436 [Pyricularia sp. CBS 133598]|nr:hypothetical protein PspLS_05436 [Pyricularia sp. CBS 133598]